MPAVVIPAVVSAAVDELGLLQITGDCHRREAIDGQRVGVADRT
jgi:hypothetical protein